MSLGAAVSLTFLTPLGGLVALAVLVTLAAALAGRARAERVRALLRLRAAPPDRLGLALVVAAPLLLALAATQPALARHSGQRVRTDAAAFVVVDVTRSMLASAGRGEPTRLARARADARRLRAELPGVPVGLATLTDRVLPLLFPTADPAVFDSTVRAAVRVEEPPPLELAPNATSFGALTALATDGYFPREVKHRAVVLLTDGGSQPYDAGSVGRALHGSLVVVRVGTARDRIYDAEKIDRSYRPDPASAARIRRLVAASGGQAVADPAAAASAVRRDLGAGPTRAGAGVVAHTPLAPYVALCALVPLGLLLRSRALAGL